MTQSFWRDSVGSKSSKLQAQLKILLPNDRRYFKRILSVHPSPELMRLYTRNQGQDCDPKDMTVEELDSRKDPQMKNGYEIDIYVLDESCSGRKMQKDLNGKRMSLGPWDEKRVTYRNPANPDVIAQDRRPKAEDSKLPRYIHEFSPRVL